MSFSYDIRLFSELLSTCSIVRSASMAQEIDCLLDNEKSTKIVSFLNFHAMNISIKSPPYFSALKKSDYLYRDGVGVEFALKIVGQDSGHNMNGTDFIPEIIRSGITKKIPIILWGTEIIYLLKAKDSIEAVGGTVVDISDGFQSFESYINRLNELEFNNAIVILGMGMPKQEYLAEKLKVNFCKGLTVINGGAIIDFIAGKQPRAPLFMRRFKLEFLFRLLREPRRLYKRTIIGGLSFLILIAMLFLNYRFDFFSRNKL